MGKGRAEGSDEDSVRLYLDGIGRYPLLTKEDEIRLAQVIEAGRMATGELERGLPLPATRERELRRMRRDAERASEQFVNANLRLVVSIAKKYQSSEMPILDLIQEGNLGLMHAVEKFDWRRGFKFSTYATWWIRQSIGRGIDNTLADRAPPGPRRRSGSAGAASEGSTGGSDGTRSVGGATRRASPDVRS